MKYSSPVDAVIASVEIVAEELLGLLSLPELLDLAFIGTASEVYRWKPSRIVDFDAFLFTGQRGAAVGTVLLGAKERLQRELNGMDVDFDLKVIRGSFKPERMPSDRPVVLAHLGVYTDQLYLKDSCLKRWAWRKYPCRVEPQRLRRLAPNPPTRDDLLLGPGGVNERLGDLATGTTMMEEWILPSMESVVHVVTAKAPLFVEFCFASCAVSARHHARTRGYLEPDTLGNDEFFVWYDQNVLHTSTLLPLMEMKARSRDEGLAVFGSRPMLLAGEFLTTLASTLAAGG